MSSKPTQYVRVSLLQARQECRFSVRRCFPGPSVVHPCHKLKEVVDLFQGGCAVSFAS